VLRHDEISQSFYRRKWFYDQKSIKKSNLHFCSSDFFEESLAPRVYESGEPFLQLNFKCLSANPVSP
jgi:hypothetical protein